MATKLNKAKATKEVREELAGYHRSQFKNVLYFASDRYKLINEVEAPKGYAFEWETNFTGGEDIEQSIIKALLKDSGLNEDFFRFERDISILGCECPSQVATIQFYTNHYSNFNKFFEMANACGINQDTKSVGGSTYRCGSHFNISAGVFGKDYDEQLQTIAKLIRIIEFNFNDYCKLLGRNPNGATWCGKLREQCDSHLTIDSNILSKLKKQGYNPYFANNHHQWLNLSHLKNNDGTARVEIRMPAHINSAEELIFRLCLIDTMIKDIKQKPFQEVLSIYTYVSSEVEKETLKKYIFRKKEWSEHYIPYKETIAR